MDELYEYLKQAIATMYADRKFGIVVDESHAFRLFQMVCHMKQVRGIVNDEDSMWNEFRRLKEDRK